MTAHEHAAPVVDEKFLTPGVMVMLGLMAVGGAFALARFIWGIGYVSNLNNQFPWGIWVAVDVASGVALAAGGFTTGLIAYVFNRNEYHAVIRPALLTAMLGYTFVVLGLLVDIGRYWNITSPIFNHNGNSVLFEVAMCVMIYLHVLYIEFIPVVVERFKGRVDLPGALAALNPLVEKVLGVADRVLGKVMFLFIIAGIVLSCLHQSSLGALMLIASYKVHPLWYTPILPLLFLLSAFAAGYPMVAFESLLVAKSFGRKPEMEVLTPLARIMPVLMGPVPGGEAGRHVRAGHLGLFGRRHLPDQLLPGGDAGRGDHALRAGAAAPGAALAGLALLRQHPVGAGHPAQPHQRLFGQLHAALQAHRLLPVPGRDIHHRGPHRHPDVPLPGGGLHLPGAGRQAQAHDRGRPGAHAPGAAGPGRGPGPGPGGQASAAPPPPSPRWATRPS